MAERERVFIETVGVEGCTDDFFGGPTRGQVTLDKLST